MSTHDSLPIADRVDALTRIAKNNAIADEDLAPFRTGTDGVDNRLPDDPDHRAKERDAFAQVVCTIIDEGLSLSSESRATMEAALCSLGFLFGFHIPPPLSQRRENYERRAGLSHSTVVRRERDAAKVIASRFDACIRRPKSNQARTNDKTAARLRAAIKNASVQQPGDDSDLIEQALQVIENYELAMRQKEAAIRSAIAALDSSNELDPPLNLD